MLNLQNAFAPKIRRQIFRRLSLCRLASLCSLGALAATGLFPSVCFAQQGNGSAQPSHPVAYASVSELNGILDQVKQTTASMKTDMDGIRIERWKTDGSTKRQTQATVDSIQRNLQTALPETIAQLTNSPDDLAASFKLYRNLVLLYDYFGQIVEDAGAFGSKDEFQSLRNDMTGLENARRALADRVQTLAGSKEDELAHLRAQVKTLTAAPPPPPKKVIIDDTEPAPKKPAAKKKPKSTSPAANPPTAKPSPNQ